MGGYSEPVDPAIRNKVMELLQSGVRNRRELDACVKHFVTDTLFADKDPPASNRRRCVKMIKQDT